MTVDREGEVKIEFEMDIVIIRRVVRDICKSIGFRTTDITRIVTAASELARNVYIFAKTGSMRWQTLDKGGYQGVELTFIDNGPGIADIEEAMQMGFSTGNGLGIGLPGAKRLMDEMNIHSEPGKGVTVTIRKWLGKP